ncbi:hypothetical protein GCM10027589_01330 [Actinocorallia lasiicapitis]
MLARNLLWLGTLLGLCTGLIMIAGALTGEGAPSLLVRVGQCGVGAYLVRILGPGLLRMITGSVRALQRGRGSGEPPVE